MTDDCQQTSDSDNERLTTDDERRTTDSDNERLTTHDDRRTTDDDMAKGKHDIRNWCPRQHKRWCTQHKKVHVSTTKQRSSMYGSATKQRSSMYGSATKQRSSMYGSAAQRHKYSSSYDEEITRAGAGTTLSPTKKRHPLLWMEAKVKCIKNGRRQTGEEDRKTGEMKCETT
eukprot:scpid85794/ scgid0627/ 